MAYFDFTWSLQVAKILPPVLRDRTFEEEDDDFKTGEADNNYIEYILISSPGHWKEFPLVGVSIWKYLQGTQSPQVLQRAILVQLESDIFTKPNINMSRFSREGIISINNITVQTSGS